MVTSAARSGREDVEHDLRGMTVRGAGPLGSIVRAVDCYEREDDKGLTETGAAPFDVSRAYLLALSNAMSVVEGVLGAEC